jgi:hypothetical protein
MPVAQAHQLVDTFLRKAAAEHAFLSASVWTWGTDKAIVDRYEQLAGARAMNDHICNVSHEASEACIAEFIKDETVFRDKDVHLSIWQTFTVSRWRERETEALTESKIIATYDIRPHLQTSLTFDSMRQFEFVRDVLSGIGLCQLNGKHLKLVSSMPVKAGTRDV